MGGGGGGVGEGGRRRKEEEKSNVVYIWDGSAMTTLHAATVRNEPQFNLAM